MPHPLIVQLRFTRSEFLRAFEGLSDADARRRILPMNCISWNIGHLACHEQGKRRCPTSTNCTAINSQPAPHRLPSH